MKRGFLLLLILTSTSCGNPPQNISPIEKLKAINDGQVISNGINADGEYDLEFLGLYQAELKLTDIPPIGSINWLAFGEKIKPEIYQHILSELRPKQYLFISRYPIKIPELNKLLGGKSGTIEMFEFYPVNDKQFNELLSRATFPDKLRMVTVIDWTFDSKLVSTFLKQHKSVTEFKAFRSNLPAEFNIDKFKKQFPKVTFDFTGSQHQKTDSR